jgi:hypothetical protein
MLLHAHPLSQARAARGEPAINSLWLWGGGRAQPLRKAFDAAGGDSPLGAAFARVAGLAWSDTLLALLDGESGSGLWLCEALNAARQRGDHFAWREAVQRFEQDCALLLRALQVGRLQRLDLVVMQDGVTRSFGLTRASAWKLWRPAPSLAQYAV